MVTKTKNVTQNDIGKNVTIENRVYKIHHNKFRNKKCFTIKITIKINDCRIKQHFS
jgi:hypothetical protein